MANPGVIPASERARVLDRDGRECCHCGSEKGLEVHHIRLTSEGGGDDPENLATLCKSCHGFLHAVGSGEERRLELLENYPKPCDVRGLNRIPNVMILDVLDEGRATPKYIKERTGLNNQQVNYGLNQLMAAGWVKKITTGLYELVGDPRGNNA